MSISTGVIESEDTNEGDNGSLDSDVGKRVSNDGKNILDLMVNRVKSELGPDLASLKGECTILPPFTGIPRSLLFDGHVVCHGITISHKDELWNMQNLLSKFAPRAQHCRFCDWYGHQVD